METPLPTPTPKTQNVLPNRVLLKTAQSRPLSNHYPSDKCPVYNASIPGSELGLLFKKFDPYTTIRQQGIWITPDVSSHVQKFKQIRTLACSGKIPVVVISLSESLAGLKVQNQQLPFSDIESMEKVSIEKFDKIFSKVVNEIKSVPALIIIEPGFLQKTFHFQYQQYRWENALIESKVLKRVQRLINSLSNAKIYMDIGSLEYISEHESHLTHIAANLNRLKNLQGFAVNSGRYVNTTACHNIAAKISCLTDGLHYVIDTSRNGGDFSKPEELLYKMKKSGHHENQLKVMEDDLLNCGQDPIKVKSGMDPVWAWGINKRSKSVRSATFDYDMSVDEVARKNKCYFINKAPQSQISNYHDAYLWLKVLGESDGRLAPKGSFLRCLAKSGNVPSCSHCPLNSKGYGKGCSC